MIWPPPISICCIPRPAPRNSQPQANRTTASRPVNTAAPSRRGNACDMGRTPLVQTPLVAEMEMRELAVGILQVKRDRAAGLADAAGDLGLSELEALRKIDAHAMLGPGHRVADRFASRDDEARNLDPRASRIDVHVETYRVELRRMLGRAHGAKHPPHRGHVLGFLPRQDLHQRIALAGIRALIDDELHATVALMHRGRPVIGGHSPQTIQPDIAEMSLVDMIACDRFAEALVRQRVELAGTGIDTIAVGEFGTLDFPFD